MKSFVDGCWKAIEFLDNEKKKLDDIKEWTPKIIQKYEDLGAYCNAIHAALETIEYYEERDAILIDRYGQDAIESAGMAWINLKMAKTNEMLGFTQEDVEKWAEENRKNQKPDTESN